MFRDEFQNGPFVDVFSAQKKEPACDWKLSSPTIYDRVFESDVKSFVVCLEGSNITSKMQLPKDTKHGLALYQKFLVLQIYIADGADFSLDIGVLDSSRGTRRRLSLSTTSKEIQTTLLHTKLPMTLIKKSTWLNLCIDLPSLVSESWKGQTYASLESICIGGNCKLRRIFTMKNQPFDTTDDSELYGCKDVNNEASLDSIPRHCMFAPNLKHFSQVVNMTKIRCCQSKDKHVDHNKSDLDADLNNSVASKKQDEYHIAFGQRVPANSVPNKLTLKDNERKNSGKEEKRVKDREKEEKRSSGKDRGKDKEERRSAGKDRQREEKKGRDKDERRSAEKEREDHQRKEERRSAGKEREDKRQLEVECENIRNGGRKEERKFSGGKERGGDNRRNREREGIQGRGGSGSTKEPRIKEVQNLHNKVQRPVVASNLHHRYPSPVEHEPTLEEIITLDASNNDSTMRDRRDSDPGASQKDPDIVVDKDSLRSSHTWTDGADGQEAPPFVKPHPPSEPSSAKHRRPARVKSAGKERTPHTGHVLFKETKSPPSGAVTSTSYLQQQHYTNSHQQQLTPMMMANEAEMEDILMAMQRSVHRQLSLEEEKNNTDSDYTSGAHDGETDSISDVIHTLNNKRLTDDNTGEGDYVFSDDEDTDKEPMQVYSFSSKPRAPHFRANSYSENNVVNLNPKSHRTRVRKKPKANSSIETVEIDSRQKGGGDAYPSDKIMKNVGKKLSNGNSSKLKSKTSSVSRSQTDFLKNASSDDEENIAAQLSSQKRRSPRNRKRPVSGKSPNMKQSSSSLTNNNTNSKLTDSKTFRKQLATPGFQQSMDYLQIPHSAHSPHLPEVDDSSSAMLMSFNKHHLRPMTDNEVKLRRSGGNRQYNPNLYSMGSESMENSMLLNNMSDGSDDEGRDGTLTGRHSMLKLEGTDSDETETLNTLKPSSEKNDYMDEIGIHIFPDDGFTTMPDHRVFSPEIVLPSQKQRQNYHYLHAAAPQQPHSITSSNSGYSSAEEELELLYDYILQCYYDPKTGIFYQLK